MWSTVRDQLSAMVSQMRMGPVEDFSNFINAVIDQNAFRTIKGYVDYAKKETSQCEVVIGGGADDREGWFIEPTVVRAHAPDFKLMREEIFGPVLTVFVYEDSRLDETLALCDKGSPYALTGAIFAQDHAAIARMAAALRNAAGNFYINDKPTGAVVNQQPFGGARASGTNDKAGSKMNLLRWVSARALKENFVPPHDWRYPFLG
jgi:1-pyrroline-5-carboxylate dehydrogenase